MHFLDQIKITSPGIIPLIAAVVLGIAICYAFTHRSQAHAFKLMRVLNELDYVVSLNVVSEGVIKFRYELVTRDYSAQMWYNTITRRVYIKPPSGKVRSPWTWRWYKHEHVEEWLKIQKMPHLYNERNVELPWYVRMLLTIKHMFLPSTGRKPQAYTPPAPRKAEKLPEILEPEPQPEVIESDDEDEAEDAPRKGRLRGRFGRRNRHQEPEDDSADQDDPEGQVPQTRWVRPAEVSQDEVPTEPFRHVEPEPAVRRPSSVPPPPPPPPPAPRPVPAVIAQPVADEADEVDEEEEYEDETEDNLDEELPAVWSPDLPLEVQLAMTPDTPRQRPEGMSNRIWRNLYAEKQRREGLSSTGGHHEASPDLPRPTAPPPPPPRPGPSHTNEDSSASPWQPRHEARGPDEGGMTHLQNSLH